MHHVVDMLDWDKAALGKLLKEAARLKKAHQEGKDKPTLQGKVLGLIFEKPSLRTRVSFQTAMAHLGGSSVFIALGDSALGQRESIADYARTLSEYVDAVVLRTYHHETVVEFAHWSGIPVINGLSDYYHPCQALGDMLTIRELIAKPEGKTVVFVGDGNNVARSLAVICGKMGLNFILTAPKGYGFDQPFLDAYHDAVPEGHLHEENDPRDAVTRADIIYTDVWTSMGQESETEKRRKQFAAYQINGDLLRLAPAHVKVMHCLPAHRGEEITDEVVDGSHSVVFQQAGNRMHAQKALLEWLLVK